MVATTAELKNIVRGKAIELLGRKPQDIRDGYDYERSEENEFKHSWSRDSYYYCHHTKGYSGYNPKPCRLADPLFDKYNKEYASHGTAPKYIPVKDRAKAYKKKSSDVCKKVDEMMEKCGYKITGLTKDNMVPFLNEIRDCFVNPEFERVSKLRTATDRKFFDFYVEMREAMWKLQDAIETGVEKKPIQAFKDFEAHWKAKIEKL